jgi:hypothetical protein
MSFVTEPDLVDCTDPNLLFHFSGKIVKRQ